MQTARPVRTGCCQAVRVFCGHTRAFCCYDIILQIVRRQPFPPYGFPLRSVAVLAPCEVLRWLARYIKTFQYSPTPLTGRGGDLTLVDGCPLSVCLVTS